MAPCNGPLPCAVSLSRQSGFLSAVETTVLATVEILVNAHGICQPHPFIRRRIKRWAFASKRDYVPYALLQTESYLISPRQTERYPSITDEYSRQTEAYPSQTSQQDKSAPLARSELNKPSSFFDLVIDNYLKDFGMATKAGTVRTTRLYIHRSRCC
uniref:DUF4744 domain-containing protein n=1 Tax=Drosophila pseudoobscura pseudoobscura TaxID=46245 RepID=B5DTR1_DROPS